MASGGQHKTPKGGIKNDRSTIVLDLEALPVNNCPEIVARRRDSVWIVKEQLPKGTPGAQKRRGLGTFSLQFLLQFLTPGQIFDRVNVVLSVTNLKLVHCLRCRTQRVNCPFSEFGQHQTQITALRAF